MARYRFPVSMGGLEWDSGVDDSSYPEVGFDLPGVSKRVWIDRTDLVLIEPPTPPIWSVVMVKAITAQPPNTDVALDGWAPGHGVVSLGSDPITVIAEWVGHVFQHRPFRGAGAWFRAGSTRAHSWPEVCAMGTPVPLIPDGPVALWAPVELPWSSPGDNVAVTVDEGVGLQVGYSAGGFTTLAPIVARKAARALWSAADEKDRIERERQRP